MAESEEPVERDGRLALVEDRVEYLEKCVVAITANLGEMLEVIKRQYGL